MSLAELPDGYVDVDRGRVRIVARRLELEEMVALLSAEERAREPEEAPAGGRGGARRVVLPGGKAVYVRKYLRGGFVRHFCRDLYMLRPPRPVRELIATEAARTAGCHVPVVDAVCVEEAGAFYRGWIVTSALEGHEAMIERYLGAGMDGRRDLLTACGRAIRALHEAGVYHVDLTGHNLLVDAGGEVATIDFDRAVLTRPGNRRLAARGMARFMRSLAKLSAQAGAELEPQAREWLEQGYAADSTLGVHR